MPIDPSIFYIENAADKLRDFARMNLPYRILVACYARVGDVISMGVTSVGDTLTTKGTITLQRHCGVLGLTKPYFVDDLAAMYLYSLDERPFQLHSITVVPDSENGILCRKFSSVEKRAATAGIIGKILKDIPQIKKPISSY